LLPRENALPKSVVPLDITSHSLHHVLEMRPLLDAWATVLCDGRTPGLGPSGTYYSPSMIKLITSMDKSKIASLG